mgnify:CR=1 FL=1
MIVLNADKINIYVHLEIQCGVRWCQMVSDGVRLSWAIIVSFLHLWERNTIHYHTNLVQKYRCQIWCQTLIVKNIYFFYPYKNKTKNKFKK